MPRYSIMIPTRGRHDTVRHTLATALALEYDDYEVVVQDNSQDGQTEAVVEKLADSRVVYNHDPDPLPMTLNWRRGLELAKGDYLTVLGDDDGIMPDALRMCDVVIERFATRIVNLAGHSYYWPTVTVRPYRNLLQLRMVFDGAQVCDSKSLLRGFYQGSSSFGELPMAINSVMHRSVIETIVAHTGDYLATPVPDVYSGIAHLWATDSFVRFMRPVKVGGMSGYSSGAGQVYRSWGTDRYRRFWEDNKKMGRILHESMIETPNIHVIVANQKLLAKERLFPDAEHYQVDIRTVLRTMADSINFDAASYDDTLADIHALAAKHGIDPAGLAIPERQPAAVPRRVKGVRFDGDSRLTDIFVDGDVAGLDNIADATRLAYSIFKQ